MAAAAKGILLIFSLSTCPVSNAEQVKLTPHFIVPKCGHNSTTLTTKDGAITMPKGGELRTHETTTMERINSTNLNIVCTLCEKVTEDILKFLRLEKTKKRIMAILHGSCSLLFNLKPKCIATVNCYGFVFFTLVKITQPRVICHMVHLCSPSLTNSTTSFISEDKCEVCRYVVAKALTELTSPNKQLEMIEYVMNTSCKAMKNTDEKCEISLISEYAPMILANTKHFLEAIDLCATTRACDSRSSFIKTDRLLKNEHLSNIYVS